MANKLVGYFDSFEGVKEKTILVDYNMTQYGCSSRFGVDPFQVGSNNATKWAVIALPDTSSPYNFVFYLVTDTTITFDVEWNAYQESRNHWSSGWEPWNKVDFSPQHTSASQMFDMGSMFGITTYYRAIYYPYIASVSVKGADNMPIIEEGESIVNVYDGGFNRSAVKAFVDEVMDTPAIPKRGYGSAVVTLNAPGENLTFESSNYEQTKIVYVHGNTSVSFDGN